MKTVHTEFQSESHTGENSSKPSHIEEDNIKICLKQLRYQGIGQIIFDQDKYQRHAFVITVMRVLFHKRLGRRGQVGGSAPWSYLAAKNCTGRSC